MNLKNINMYQLQSNENRFIALVRFFFLLLHMDPISHQDKMTTGREVMQSRIPKKLQQQRLVQS